MVNNLLKLLNDNNIKIAIVTTAPRPYCEKIIRYNCWNIDVTVCYHDCSLKKPNPQPLLLAVERLHDDLDNVISAGDKNIDILASKRAGIVSVGCLWGAEDKLSLINSEPDFLVESVNKFCTLLKKRFGIKSYLDSRCNEH